MLKFVIIPVTPFDQNCSLIWCDETKRGAAVDPGGDVDRILAEAERQAVMLEKILLTHGHLDHVGGTAALAEQLRTHRAESRLYRTLATLRTDVPLAESLDDLRWRGADREALVAFCASIGDERFVERVPTFQ